MVFQNDIFMFVVIWRCQCGHLVVVLGEFDDFANCFVLGL